MLGSIGGVRPVVGRPCLTEGEVGPTSEASAADEGRKLVFALCHEIGNLVAAIRLEAHLIDGESGALGLARAAISIDDTSSRVGALLTQVRPLLEPARPSEIGSVSPAGLLANLRDGFGDRGVGGARVEVDVGGDLPAVVGDPERTNALLWLVALGALEAVQLSGGTVRVDACERGEHVAISVCDDGAPDSELGDWRNAAQRGRSLVCQVAESLVRPLGGFVDVSIEEGETCVVLCLARVER